MSIVLDVPDRLNPYIGGRPADCTFSVGTEGSNIITVAAQLKDRQGNDIASRRSLAWYLSDDAHGDTVSSAPSGGVAAGTDGVVAPNAPSVQDALLVDGNLAIDATPEKFKTGQTSAFVIGGLSHTKAATTAIAFSAGHVVSASKFGVILVQINAAGTISTKVPLATQAYTSAPLALAALPAADAGNIALGYIAVAADSGGWTAITDDLTDGSDLTTAAFTDAAETTLSNVSASGRATSEADGDIDFAVTHVGAKTFYLVVVLPDGTLRASGAIAFV